MISLKISLLTLKIKHSWYFILQSARIYSKLKVALDCNPRQIDVDEWTTHQSHTQLVLYLNPYDFRQNLPIFCNLSHLSLKPECFVVFTVAVSFMTYSLLLWLLVTCFGKQPKIILLIWKLPRYPGLVNRVFECIYRLVFVRFLSPDILKHFRSNIKISVSILWN